MRVLSREARRILDSGVGYRYGEPEETDAVDVLRFEVEELGNFHIVVENGKRSVDELVEMVERRYGADACAVWLTSTRGEAGWYRDVGEFMRVPVPGSAGVLSDLGSGGVLLVASRGDARMSGWC